ncbi:MAG: EamA family transporter, partial [Cyclobacteriaceae bacterium]
MSATRDYLRLHFIVLLWGFTAILGAMITIPSVEIVFYRTLFAFIGLGILLKLRKRMLKLPLSALIPILGTGALIAAHW